MVHGRLYALLALVSISLSSLHAHGDRFRLKQLSSRVSDKTSKKILERLYGTHDSFKHVISDVARLQVELDEMKKHGARQSAIDQVHGKLMRTIDGFSRLQKQLGSESINRDLGYLIPRLKNVKNIPFQNFKTMPNLVTQQQSNGKWRALKWLLGAGLVVGGGFLAVLAAKKAFKNMKQGLVTAGMEKLKDLQKDIVNTGMEKLGIEELDNEQKENFNEAVNLVATVGDVFKTVKNIKNNVVESAKDVYNEINDAFIGPYGDESEVTDEVPGGLGDREVEVTGVTTEEAQDFGYGNKEELEAEVIDF